MILKVGATILGRWQKDFSPFVVNVSCYGETRYCNRFALLKYVKRNLWKSDILNKDADN